MDRSSLRHPRPLIVIDAAAPEARDVYDRARADGAELAVHGAAPWADEGDVVDVGTAAFLGLYAVRVVGGGLPGSVAGTGRPPPLTMAVTRFPFP